MSRSARRHHAKDAHTQTMLATVRSEMAQRYVEVEKDGTSLARFLCIYLAGAREARLRMMHGVRSIFRLRTAH